MSSPVDKQVIAEYLADPMGRAGIELTIWLSNYRESLGDDTCLLMLCKGFLQYARVLVAEGEEQEMVDIITRMAQSVIVDGELDAELGMGTSSSSSEMN